MFRVHRTYIAATELALELELDSSLLHHILHDPTIQVERRDMHRRRFSVLVRISSMVTLTSNLTSFQLCRGPPPHIRTRQFFRLNGPPPILSFLNHRSAKSVHRRFLEE